MKLTLSDDSDRHYSFKFFKMQMVIWDIQAFQPIVWEFLEGYDPGNTKGAGSG